MGSHSIICRPREVIPTPYSKFCKQMEGEIFMKSICKFVISCYSKFSNCSTSKKTAYKEIRTRLVAEITNDRAANFLQPPMLPQTQQLVMEVGGRVSSCRHRFLTLVKSFVAICQYRSSCSKCLITATANQAVNLADDSLVFTCRWLHVEHKEPCHGNPGI